MQRATQTRVNRAGMTLVELLVVLGILGLLAVLLLSSLSPSVKTAQGASCQENLRQLQLAWTAYALDHEDQLPPNRFHPVPGTEYGRSAPGSWVVGHSRLDLDTRFLRRGVLFPYLPSYQVFKCPADVSTVDHHPELASTRSYGLSGYFNGEPFPELQSRYRSTLSAIMVPAARFSFIDEHEQHGNGFFLISPEELHNHDWYPVGLNHLAARRHNLGFNLAFADGHIERLGILQPSTFLPGNEGGPDLTRLRGLIPLQSDRQYPIQE